MLTQEMNALAREIENKVRAALGVTAIQPAAAVAE